MLSTESHQWLVDKGYPDWWERDMLDTENCDWATDPYNCCRTHDGCCRPQAASPDNISPNCPTRLNIISAEITRHHNDAEIGEVKTNPAIEPHKNHKRPQGTLETTMDLKVASRWLGTTKKLGLQENHTVPQGAAGECKKQSCCVWLLQLNKLQHESALTLSAFEKRLRAGLVKHTMRINPVIEQNKNIKWSESPWNQSSTNR